MRFLLQFLAAILVLASAAGASAADYKYARKNTEYAPGDEKAFVVFTYRRITGAISAPSFRLSRIDPETGEELSTTRLNLSMSGRGGLRRHMRNAGYEEFQRGMIIETFLFEPGVYVVTEADRAGQLYEAEGTQKVFSMAAATLAFELTPGKVNYLGDFAWGTRSRKICSLTRTEFEENPIGYKNAEEKQCYDQMAASDGEKRLISLRVNATGLADDYRLSRRDDDRRLAYIKTFLERFQPALDPAVEIIFPRRADVTLLRDLPTQLAAAWGASDAPDAAAASENTAPATP